MSSSLTNHSSLVQCTSSFLEGIRNLKNSSSKAALGACLAPSLNNGSSAVELFQNIFDVVFLNRGDYAADMLNIMSRDSQIDLFEIENNISIPNNKKRELSLKLKFATQECSEWINSVDQSLSTSLTLLTPIEHWELKDFNISWEFSAERIAAKINNSNENTSFLQLESNIKNGRGFVNDKIYNENHDVICDLYPIKGKNINESIKTFAEKPVKVNNNESNLYYNILCGSSTSGNESDSEYKKKIIKKKISSQYTNAISSISKIKPTNSKRFLSKWRSLDDDVEAPVDNITDLQSNLIFTTNNCNYDNQDIKKSYQEKTYIDSTKSEDTILEVQEISGKNHPYTSWQSINRNKLNSFGINRWNLFQDSSIIKNMTTKNQSNSQWQLSNSTSKSYPGPYIFDEILPTKNAILNLLKAVGENNSKVQQNKLLQWGFRVPPSMTKLITPLIKDLYGVISAIRCEIISARAEVRRTGLALARVERFVAGYGSRYLRFGSDLWIESYRTILDAIRMYAQVHTSLDLFFASLDNYCAKIVQDETKSFLSLLKAAAAIHCNSTGAGDLLMNVHKRCSYISSDVALQWLQEYTTLKNKSSDFNNYTWKLSEYCMDSDMGNLAGDNDITFLQSKKNRNFNLDYKYLRRNHYFLNKNQSNFLFKHKFKKNQSCSSSKYKRLYNFNKGNKEFNRNLKTPILHIFLASDTYHATKPNDIKENYTDSNNLINIPELNVIKEHFYLNNSKCILHPLKPYGLPTEQSEPVWKKIARSASLMQPQLPTLLDWPIACDLPDWSTVLDSHIAMLHVLIHSMRFTGNLGVTRAIRGMFTNAEIFSRSVLELTRILTFSLPEGIDEQLATTAKSPIIAAVPERFLGLMHKHMQAIFISLRRDGREGIFRSTLEKHWASFAEPASESIRAIAGVGLLFSIRDDGTWPSAEELN